MEPGRIARRCLVTGLVQGVAFRWHTRERATELGLAGWVRNLRDGRVEVWAAGPVEAVESLVAWLRVGPPAARVTDLTADRVELGSADDPGAGASFEIRRTS